MNIIFTTNVVAPFQQELAIAYVKAGFGKFDVFCSDETENGRGAHWSIAESLTATAPEVIREKRQGRLRKIANEALGQKKYDVLISGGFRHSLAMPFIEEAKRCGIKVVIWTEPPDFRKPKLLLLLYYWSIVNWRLRKVDLILTIGDRCLRWYEGLSNRPVRFFPYSQRLSSIKRTARNPTAQFTLVFSGRLLPRNNIICLADTLIQLWRKFPGQFRFILAAEGPEASIFWRKVDSCVGLRKAIEVAAHFDTWEGRLDPFLRADVLLYPSLHSGWGLVIPEAMACGCVPVATASVESARYFIDPGVSGLIIKPTVEDAVKAVTLLFLERNRVAVMSEYARIDSMKGDVLRNAERLNLLLKLQFRDV